jgi:hypothetical protein
MSVTTNEFDSAKRIEAEGHMRKAVDILSGLAWGIEEMVEHFEEIAVEEMGEAKPHVGGGLKPLKS